MMRNVSEHGERVVVPGGGVGWWCQVVVTGGGCPAQAACKRKNGDGCHEFSSWHQNPVWCFFVQNIREPCFWQEDWRVSSSGEV